MPISVTKPTQLHGYRFLSWKGCLRHTHEIWLIDVFIAMMKRKKKTNKGLCGKVINCSKLSLQ